VSKNQHATGCKRRIPTDVIGVDVSVSRIEYRRY
jgi:hypothetical protein